MGWRLLRSKQSKRKPGYLTESQPDPSSTALSLRGLTLGYPAPTAVSSATSLGEVKASLLDPNQAREVISKLHGLPISTQQHPSSGKTPSSAATIPIHAVCLDCSDEAAHEKWFSKLPHALISAGSDDSTNSAPSVAQAHADVLDSFFKEIHLVSVVETPDFGFGQPPGGKGILSGSIPTAQAISNGLSQATQQLMSFGFTSTTAIWPNHAGVYPPTDRMSVITYWWGLEVCLPPPSIKYLSHVPSISHAMLNFLSTIAVVSNGAREILPFVRYISQYIDFEWSTIKAQDKGKGVVCAATWIMPAAMVPRPWDFASKA